MVGCFGRGKITVQNVSIDSSTHTGHSTHVRVRVTQKSPFSLYCVNDGWNSGHQAWALSLTDGALSQSKSVVCLVDCVFNIDAIEYVVSSADLRFAYLSLGTKLFI